jgi:hypothetical protein
MLFVSHEASVGLNKKQTRQRSVSCLRSVVSTVQYDEYSDKRVSVTFVYELVPVPFLIL